MHIRAECLTIVLFENRILSTALYSMSISMIQILCLKLQTEIHARLWIRAIQSVSRSVYFQMCHLYPNAHTNTYPKLLRHVYTQPEPPFCSLACSAFVAASFRNLHNVPTRTFREWIFEPNWRQSVVHISNWETCQLCEYVCALMFCVYTIKRILGYIW